MVGNARRRNGVTVTALAMVLVAMGGLVYASVPPACCTVPWPSA